MNQWAEHWIGLPYEEGGRGPGYDCLGFFLALQKERFGRKLPDPACTMTQAIRRKAFETAEGSGQWKPIDKSLVKEGDALLFRVSGFVLHVGYALNSVDMLHCEKFASEIINWHGVLWASRLQGCYRYAA